MNNLSTLNPETVTQMTTKSAPHTPDNRKKLASAGVSFRALRMLREMPAECTARWRTAALWDVDPKRFEVYAERFPDATPPAAYLGDIDTFERMLVEIRPDLVFVATLDRYHFEPILAALRQDTEVLVEKPMVIDCKQAQAVLEAEAASKARVHVGFNYRYQAGNQEVKQLLMDGAIGRITAVDISIYVDEIHGSSYFQRWNRLRDNSGGLSIHKEGHYIDLIGWWLNQRPVEVFCYGALNYYGPDAEMNPSLREGRHCGDCNEIAQCKYAQARLHKQASDRHIGDVQGQASSVRLEKTNAFTGYRPDMCIFDSEIDIEDTYSAVMRYEGGTFVNFAVNFSSPIELYRVVLSGTRGRIEKGYSFSRDSLYREGKSLAVHYPLFGGEPRFLDYRSRPGGHGGGDPALLQDVLSGNDTHLCRASTLDGAYAVAVGEAMWRSAKSGQPVRIEDLLNCNFDFQ